MSDKSILLLDDDDDDCFLFKDALNEVDDTAELTTTNSCDQLIDLLSEPGAELPDLIVMDLNMPGVNGFECLECLKVTRTLKHIPVVIFSTGAQHETTDRVYDQGAAECIAKPNTFGALKEIVTRLLALDPVKR